MMPKRRPPPHQQNKEDIEMIKIFVTIGIVGGLVIAYLAVFQLGPISQDPPAESLLTGFRAEGFVPESKSLVIDESAEELGVFQVPAEDEAQLEIALANAPVMDMGTTEGAAMDMPATDGATTAMDMPAGDGTAMNTDTTMSASNTAMDMGVGGLKISEDGAFDREIDLTMAEWEFSEMQIDVKVGERIKFIVSNGGEIPHEFMFMNGPLMEAVQYRSTRADWNLFEHEALFEQALVLPGGEFSFVLEVTEAGSWMFMCMLPYHMQMGMMGQMATEGMAMQM
jgi:uncharacterized cupredoxin-like copper-binding protein